MLNENLNPTNWKAKLETMEQLEGESSFDATACWNKLYVRLDKKKQRPVARWYRLAAASLIIAVITTIFFYSQKQSFPTPQFNGIANDKTENNNIIIIKSDDISKKNLPEINIKNSMITKDNLVKIAEIPHKRIIVPEIKSNDTISNTTNASASFVKLQDVDTTLYATAVVPLKKKLKVVHINTIDESVNMPQYMVRTPGKKFFQLKVGNQRSLQNTANAENNNTPLFEIKSSLN